MKIKKSVKITIGALLMALLGSVLGLFLINNQKTYATEGQTEPWRNHVAYQGQDNWYQLSGDFSNNELINMLYSKYYDFWQGQSESNRFYNDRMLQMPSDKHDAIRGKVISKNAKLSIVGQVEVFEQGVNSQVEVTVAIAKNGDMQDLQSIGNATLSGTNKTLSINTTVQVESGDVLYYVAAPISGQTVAGAIFKLELAYSEVTSSSVPTTQIDYKSIEINNTDLTFVYNNDGNALDDTAGIIKNIMMTGNAGGNLSYAYQTPGMSTLTDMDFAGWDTAGYWYTKPETLNSCGVVWNNKFYTNTNDGYGYSGLLYSAPQDGVVNLIGATARSSKVELGDDGSSPDEKASWTLFKVVGNTFQALATDTIERDTIKYIGSVEGTQNITIKAGEKLFLRYNASAPWKVACITAAFDYVAEPIDVFEGWQTTNDVEESDFALANANQGDNHWYTANGSQEKYSLFVGENGVYEGEDVFSKFSAKGNIFKPSTSKGIIKVYKAVGTGTARLAVNAIKTETNAEEFVVSVYKRAYSGGAWGEAQQLFTQVITAKKAFAEYNDNEIALNNGDLILVVVSANSTDTAQTVTSGVATNVYVDFNVTTTGTEVDGIGEFVSQFIEETYFEEQGTNGWFYAYGSVDNYVLMERGFGNVNYERWNGPEWNTAVEAGYQCIGAYSGTMLIYVANTSGTLKIEGMATLLKCDSLEGVIANIYHNGNSIWQQSYAHDDKAGKTISLAFEVAAGDVIMFHAEHIKGATVGYATNFYYNVSYIIENPGANVIEEKELINYLSAKGSYAEYIGITANTSTIPPVELSEGGGKGCGVKAFSGVIMALVTVVATAFVIKRRK